MKELLNVDNIGKQMKKGTMYHFLTVSTTNSDIGLLEYETVSKGLLDEEGSTYEDIFTRIEEDAEVLTSSLIKDDNEVFWVIQKHKYEGMVLTRKFQKPDFEVIRILNKKGFDDMLNNPETFDEELFSEFYEVLNIEDIFDEVKELIFESNIVTMWEEEIYHESQRELVSVGTIAV